MVIFGAGASYDSFQKAPPQQYPQYRPPLANELFGQRFCDEYLRFPQSHPVILRLQQSTVSVENTLEELQQDATDHYPAGLSQLAAVRYYLGYMLGRCQTNWTQQVPKGATNYKYLLDKIVPEDPLC